MTIKQSSSTFVKERDRIRALIEAHPNWTNSIGFTERWKPFSRAQIRDILNNDDCRVCTLNSLGQMIGLNLGKLLGLGDWEFDNEGVGEKIRLVREKTGLNVKRFAEQIGFTNTYIHDLEQGRCKGGLPLVYDGKIGHGFKNQLKGSFG